LKLFITNIASTSFMKRAVAAVFIDHSRLEGDPQPDALHLITAEAAG
jgi:hypothetical protein